MVLPLSLRTNAYAVPPGPTPTPVPPIPAPPGTPNKLKYRKFDKLHNNLKLSRPL